MFSYILIFLPLLLLLKLLNIIVSYYHIKKSFFSHLPQHTCNWFFYDLASAKETTDLLYHKIPKNSSGALVPFVHVGPSITGSNHILVNDAMAIRDVLMDHETFIKNPELYKGGIAQNGLIGSSGELWKRDRRLMTPLFFFNQLKMFHNRMVYYGKEMANDLVCIEGWREIRGVYLNYTLKILVACIFGDKFNEEEQKECCSLFRELFDHIVTTVTGCNILGPQLFSKVHPLYGRYQKFRLNVIEKVEKIRKEGHDHDNALFSRIILAKTETGEMMSTEQVVDEAITLLIAGHETTSGTLSFISLLLTKNQQVQEKLRKEIFDTLGSDRDPTSDDMKNMTYLKYVIKESLRLFATVPILSRKAVKDTKLNDLIVPKGTVVTVNIMGSHMDPKYWEKPLEFIPERHSGSFVNRNTVSEDKDNNNDGGEGESSAYQYIPFSVGKRNCIGQKFAMQQMETVLTMVLKRVRFVDFAPKDYSTRYHITLEMVEKLKINCEAL